MGTFTWLLAHWERDWKPLMTYLAVQLLVGYQLYVQPARIEDLWIAAPERARPLSELGSQWMIWTGLALGLWLAIRDRRERATGLEPGTARERLRRLISRSVAVTVLAALAHFPMLWFGWALHDMQQVGSWDRALGVFTSSLSEVVFLLLFLLVTLLPVSTFGGLKLVVVLAAAWSPWLLIPGLALAAWSLFGAEHDPDTIVRPRRAWPCAIALLAFSLSVDGCSQRHYEENRPGNGVLHSRVMERVGRLAEEGRLEDANFRMPTDWKPLWENDGYGDSREVVIGDRSTGDKTYRRDRGFLRITEDGHLEAIRDHWGRRRIHRYPDPDGRPFGPDATIQRADQEPVIYPDPGPSPPAGGFKLPDAFAWANDDVGQKVLGMGEAFADPERVSLYRVGQQDTPTIQSALRQASIDMRALVNDGEDISDRCVVITVPPGKHAGFGAGSMSPHSEGFVHAHLWQCTAVYIIGVRPQRPRLPGMDPGAPRPNRCRSIVTADRYIPGGDTINFGDRDGHGPREGARLVLCGLQIEACGRAAMLVNVGRTFELLVYQCHLATNDNAITQAANEGSAMKWGCQLYAIDDMWIQCSAHLNSIAEHVWYWHGHGTKGTQIINTLTTACGGQVCQWTEREMDVRDAPVVPAVVQDCVFTGFGQNPGRASMAITAAGAGRALRIFNTVVVDDNPDDTLGQDPSKVGTSYGALTTWTPHADEQSYADEDPTQKGHGNLSLEVVNSVFAIRDGNRPIANITDLVEGVIRGTRFMTGGNSRSLQGLVAPQLNESGRMVERFLYDGSTEPTEQIRKRADVVARGRLDEDYDELPFEVMRTPSGSGVGWHAPDSVFEVI